MSGPVRQPVYEFAGFRLDAQRRVLFDAEGQPILLSPRLFEALSYLVERSGQLLTKEQLLRDLWPNVVVEEHNLNKTVSELRRVLGEKPGEHRFIVTTPGRGYRFVADVSTAPLLEEPVKPAAAGIATTVRPDHNARRSGAAWWVGGAIAAVVATLAALWPSPEPPLRVTPWSVEKGQQWFPAWSPDSASTAFVRFGGPSGDPPDLLVRDLDEPIPRRIARRPVDSPGGVTRWTTTGKILYMDIDGLWSISPVGGPTERVVALDYQRLGLGNLWLRMADVTRDGATLAAFTRDGNDSVAIWTATPPSGALEKYEPAPFAGATFFGGPYLRFSPSGRQLLLTFYAAGRGFEAWLVPFPSDPRSPPRRVLEGLPIVGDSAEFSWFPDDRHILLTAMMGATAEGANRQLYLADTASGAYRLLPVTFNSPNGPVVSPDGSKAIVHDSRVDFDIVTLDVRTGVPTWTITTDRAEILPAWAADKNAMVYATDRSGSWEVWLREESLPDRPLITTRAFAAPTLLLFAPTLSPDGERVIFHRVAEEGDESRLWISAIAGGQPEALTNEELTERAGSWSPDGGWYVYWASPRQGGKSSLKKVRTTGRAAPETLLDDLQMAPLGPAPVWSPDGQWVLVAHEGLTLVPVDGTPPRSLGSEAMPCAFADTEPLLYCIRGSLGAIRRGEYFLVVLDLDGNEIRSVPLPAALRPVSGLSPGIRLSPTPDRLGLTYSVESTAQNLWLVEGLDRLRQ
jgi:DNA-binding winged helix-turn-helix (wHTH) protein